MPPEYGDQGTECPDLHPETPADEGWLLELALARAEAAAHPEAHAATAPEIVVLLRLPP
jgi:hypothetical protein